MNNSDPSNYDQLVLSTTQDLINKAGKRDEYGIVDAMQREQLEEAFYQETILPQADVSIEQLADSLSFQVDGIAQNVSSEAFEDLSNNEAISNTTMVSNNIVFKQEMAQEDPAPGDSTVSEEEDDRRSQEPSSPRPVQQDIQQPEEIELPGAAGRKQARKEGLMKSSGLDKLEADNRKSQAEQRQRGLKQGEKPIEDLTDQQKRDFLLRGGQGFVPPFMSSGFNVSNNGIPPMQQYGNQVTNDNDVAGAASFAMEEAEDAALAVAQTMQRLAEICMYLQSQMSDINNILDRSFGG